jgi:hypothetical protein
MLVFQQMLMLNSLVLVLPVHRISECSALCFGTLMLVLLKTWCWCWSSDAGAGAASASY